MWHHSCTAFETYFIITFISFQPILNPKYRCNARTCNEWHTQDAQKTSSTGSFFKNSLSFLSPTLADETSAPKVLDDSNDAEHSLTDCFEEQARASSTPFAVDDVAVEYAKDEVAPPARSDFDGDADSDTAVALTDAVDEDADYVESYGLHSVLPAIRNFAPPSSTSSPKLPCKVSTQATIKLAKVSLLSWGFQTIPNHSASQSSQVVIGVPMSKSGHNIALNRWMRSQAVVAEQYCRRKQVLAGPPDFPPALERISPSTFRKTLTNAPPSRVLSPDSKPAGNVGIAIRISPVRKSPEPASPQKSSSAKQRSHRFREKISANRLDVLQVDSTASPPSPPSPPPPRVMRLGGIFSGDKNVFVSEKSERSVGSLGVDHFGRSNVFSK